MYSSPEGQIESNRVRIFKAHASMTAQWVTGIVVN